MNEYDEQDARHEAAGWVRRPGGGWMPTQGAWDAFVEEYVQWAAEAPAATPCPDWCEGTAKIPAWPNRDHRDWIPEGPGHYYRIHEARFGSHVRVSVVETWRNGIVSMLDETPVIVVDEGHSDGLQRMDATLARQVAADLLNAAGGLDEIKSAEGARL